MNEPVTIAIPRLIGRKIVKKLTFDMDGLKIERPSTFAPADHLPANEIVEFRYGIKWIKGYAFTIGRHYFIDLRDMDGVITTIKLKSYYGIRKDAGYTLWNEIIQQLWAHYFSAIFNHYFDLFKNYQTFELAGVKFLFEGIGFENNYRIPWEDIALSNYRTYFVIHPRQNPKENKSLYFARDWNAFILQRLLKKIIDQHK